LTTASSQRGYDVGTRESKVTEEGQCKRDKKKKKKKKKQKKNKTKNTCKLQAIGEQEEGLLYQKNCKSR